MITLSGIHLRVDVEQTYSLQAALMVYLESSTVTEIAPIGTLYPMMRLCILQRQTAGSGQHKKNGMLF
jgi:hypothetical protein